ncbi:hypothetical protein GALL_507050 [mine drainage metagenome]|uniref:TNase-like domain-containing protein n=1 Tax=mine drainage metagenome TaxID=410659 RepID=A0A1J5P811_9ZZZZ
MNTRQLLAGLGQGAGVLALVFGGVAGAQAEVFMAIATAVPDGDTLWVQPDSGAPRRKLRLLGIDAPEICQTGGAAARQALRRLVGRNRLRIVVNFNDDYARGLARIEVNGQDVAAAMVRSGNAWSYAWRGRSGPYAEQEAAARRAQAGLFAQPQPERPRDFRQHHGSCYRQDADGSFRIK